MDTTKVKIALHLHTYGLECLFINFCEVLFLSNGLKYKLKKGFFVSKIYQFSFIKPSKVVIYCFNQTVRSLAVKLNYLPFVF